MKRRRVEVRETGILYRSFEVEKRTIDPDARTMEIRFSSEFPVRRFFGTEILDHKRKAVRMEWLSSGRAPFLVDHRTHDRVGVIEKARIDTKERVGVATVRFGKSDRASEILTDFADGIRSSVSVGYLIHDAVLERISEERGEEWRVTDWEPLEVSDAALPADPTASARVLEELGGFPHRAGDLEAFRTTFHGREEDMPRIKVRRLLDGHRIEIEEDQFDEAIHERITAGPRNVDDDDPPAKPEETREQWLKNERKRVEEITALATRWNCRDKGDEFIAKGHGVEAFRGWLLMEHIPDGQPLDTPASELGLSDKESRSYSFLRAIRAHADKDWSEAGFEREASQEIAKRVGRPANGFFVPVDALRVRRQWSQTAMERIADTLSIMLRDQTKGTPGEGGFLVGTDHMAASFIELLRNRAMVTRLGARLLSGLVGDITIPRQSGGATSAWVTEGNSPALSTLAFTQVAMDPKTVAARANMTRKLLLQSSPDIEDLVRMDLIQVLALEIDRAAINGSGAGAEPEGILNTTGVGLVPLGAPDGGPPTWPLIVSLETEVAIDSADIGALAMLTTVQARGTLKTTEKATNTAQFIWEMMAGEGDPRFGAVNGYRAAASNQVPSNLTKGAGTNLSAAIFGNWNDLLIGEWGILDVTTDPFTLGDSGGLVVRAFQDVDIAVRHPESFAIIVDMVTT